MKNNIEGVTDIFYDKNLKRVYWLLGYFGGGAINFTRFREMAKKYSRQYNVDMDTIHIDTITKSSSYKHFKILFADIREDMECTEDMFPLNNVWEFVHR